MSKTNYVTRRWTGYTLEELRNQRTIVNARIMIERHRLATNVDRLRETFVARSKPASVVSRMFSALTYIDWAVMGITVIRKVAPLFSSNHRHHHRR